MNHAVAHSGSEPRHQVFDRWRKRSQVIRRLRVLLPALIGLILITMTGFMVRTTLMGQKAKPVDAQAPIQLVNPRFVGRDNKGRAFVLTAKTATRDPQDYQRVLLNTPALVLDEEGRNPMRISAMSDVYREEARMLSLEGGVKLNGADLNFTTASSIFNTATGELLGTGEIQGVGALGEIIAKSYGVYDKGDRLVFKGGVHTRVDSK